MAKKTSKTTIQVDDSFTIKDEFKNLLPRLSADDIRKLERSILKEGCRDKLIIWDEENLLIDGHHRYEICDNHRNAMIRKHKRLYEVERKSFKSKEEAVAWVIDNQRGRRNMNKFQWAEVVLENKSSIKATAKANQRAGGGAVRKKSAKPVNTLDTLAKLAGISRPTLQQIEYILDNADQKTIDKLRKGEAGYSINSVYEALKEAQPNKDTATPKRTSPMRNIAVRIEKVISTLNDIDKKCTQIDRTNFYDKIINWAMDKKAGLAEPVE